MNQPVGSSIPAQQTMDTQKSDMFGMLHSNDGWDEDGFDQQFRAEPAQETSSQPFIQETKQEQKDVEEEVPVAAEPEPDIRKLADNCTGLQGFLIFHSFGGGTGSGF